MLQALIAGGTFNGDVYIWDLSLEGDMQRGKTDALSDMRHRCMAARPVPAKCTACSQSHVLRLMVLPDLCCLQP